MPDTRSAASTAEALLEALVEDLQAELSRVQRELEDAQFALACTVRAAGGRVEIPRSVMAEMPRDAEITRAPNRHGAVVFTLST